MPKYTPEEFTPTTEQVRQWYVLFDHSGDKSTEEYEAEFERWLIRLIAAEQHKGYGQGWTDGYKTAKYDCVQEQNMSM